MVDLFSLITSYSYLGLFISSLIGSGSIILPLPSAAMIFAAGNFLNPFLVGIVAGLGSALGEVFGYLIGLGGRKVIDKKTKKDVKKWDKYFKKHGGFFIIFLFAVTPLPDDIAGIMAGMLNYPFEKFFIASLIGKIILSLVLAYAGFYGIGWIMQYF